MGAGVVKPAIPLFPTEMKYTPLYTTARELSTRIATCYSVSVKEVLPSSSSDRERERAFVTSLRKARAEYRQTVAAHLHTFENADKEGWSVYGSGLRGPDINGERSYFGERGDISFRGLDGYNPDKLVQHVISFLSQPENIGREVLILDAMGQGKVGADIREEVCKKIADAKITVIATTLTPRHDTSYDATEFNGDTLSDTYSDPVFDEIERRKSSGAALLVTFFRPVGALWEQPDNIYVLHSLYVRLQKIFNATEEHGLLFLQAHAHGNDISFLSALFKKASAEALFFMRPHSVALLKKESSLCPRSPFLKEGHLELPTEQELLTRHVDLLQKYWPEHFG